MKPIYPQFLSFLLLCQLSTSSATAQLTPDSTLGAESSIVTPEATRQLIEGGATRGSNLFHSFTDFNVNENQRVDFANPATISNIFTRVTGANISHIFGTLGVEGTANLFLLNPNGIIFGPNAQLDLRGSFVATTAESLLFENNMSFSASNPQAPPLLTINVPIGLQYGSNSTATISNRGNLSVGGNFKLGAANLDLQGQLQAGGDLTLQATDTLQIRDSETNPFIAAANGQLLVQGNNKVDIFALNHPDSGLYAAGDLVLRSGNRVGGDAHYWSGRNFRVEDLQGSLGNLYSPYDPIIVVRGDVELVGYEGTSLHIIAGGEVKLGTVKITGPDLSGYTISPTHPDPVLQSLAPVTLGDGTTQIIDGSTFPTLDIRAGVDSATINNVLNNTNTPNIGLLVNPLPLPPGIIVDGNSNYIPTPSTQNINIGAIQVSVPNGLVFLKGNDVDVNGSIITNNSEGGGHVVLDAGNRLTIDGIIDTGSSGGNGGNVRLIANNDLSFNNTQIKTESGTGNSGTINLISNSGSIGLNNSTLSTSSSLPGSGDINLNAANIVTEGNVFLTSQNDIKVSTGIDGSSSTSDGSNLDFKARNNISIPGGISTASGSGNGGNVKLDAGNTLTVAGNITTDAVAGNGGNINLSGSNLAINYSLQTSALGSAGSVEINSAGTLNLSAAVETRSLIGDGGSITLTGDNLNIYNNLNSSAFGDGGDVTLATSGNIWLQGDIITDSDIGTGGAVNLKADGNIFALGAIATGTLTGEGGDISLAGDNVYLNNNLNSSAFGDGGDVTLKANENLELKGNIITGSENGTGGAVNLTSEGYSSLSGTITTGTATGQGGNIYLGADRLNISGDVNSYSIYERAGDIIAIADSLKILSELNAWSQYRDGGNIITIADRQTISKSMNSYSELGNAGAIISSSLWGTQVNAILNAQSPYGFGGNIAVLSQGNIEIGSSALSTSSIFLDSGNIYVNANNGNLKIDNSLLQTNTYGIGDAGTIALHANNIQVQNSTNISASTRDVGNAGKIDISAQAFTAETDSRIFANTDNIGNAGQIDFKIQDSLNLDRAFVFVNTDRGAGNAGTINMNAGNVTAQNGTLISAASDKGGMGGNIQIDAPGGTVNFIGNDPNIASSTALALGSFGGGAAGNLGINARQILVQNGAQLYGSNDRASGGNAASMTFNASESLQVTGTTPGGELFSSIASDTFGSWNAGNLSINTPQFIVRDGGRVSAGTTGSGNAGSLTVRSNLVEVTGTSANGQRASQIVFDSYGTGDAGQLKIETQQLLLQNGGQILGRTGGAGLGGAIEINATEWARISGKSGDFASGLIFESNGSGNARGIRLQTSGDLTVENGGKITVSGTGSGVSGDLDITARNIFLTNQGQLAASTRATQGGNIRLQVSDKLILRHNSEITAEAFGDSTGGNINMKVGQLISAVLSENSDIVANSQSGRGGKIYSDALALGFRQFNGRRTPESDFTAISEQGGPDLSGTVIVTRNVPPIVELPNRFAPPALSEGCSVTQASNKSPSGRGEFIIPGRGGLPPHPSDMLSQTMVEIPWENAEEEKQTAPVAKLVEAVNFEPLPDGGVRLIPPDNERLGHYPLACQFNEEESKRS